MDHKKPLSCLFWPLLSAFIMLALPWSFNMFVPWNHGISANMLLYWVIVPVYSIVLGAYAGKAPKERWGLLVLTAVLCAAGATMRSSRADEPVYDGGICLALGLVSMWFRAL